MKTKLEYIIRNVLSEVISEQEQQAPGQQESGANVFNDQEKRFLGTFAKAGSQNLGIIYSISDIGIREFIARSGHQFECTPAILLTLLHDKYIKIVPYTGYGRDTDYTIELQIPIDAVQQYASLVGKSDDEPADGAPATDSGGGGGSFGGGGGGGGMPPPMDDLGGDVAGDAAGGDDIAADGGDPLDIETDDDLDTEPPDLEVAHVIKYGDLLTESVKITKQLMLEASKSKKKSSKSKVTDIKIHLDKSRILRRVPREFIHQLKRVIHKMKGRTFNKYEQERLIADIIDNLQLNFELSDKQILRSFEFHRNQKRLQQFLDKE